MRVGIIQSNYIPWRGYFDFIDEVDLFILLDDVQYTRRDWRSRNYIKTKAGLIALSVPVHFSLASPSAIQDTSISYEHDWCARHLALIKQAYLRAPFFDEYYEQFKKVILTERWTTISSLNNVLIKWLCGCLDIRTPIRFSHEYASSGSKTERLVGILKAVGASQYLSGKSASAYLDLDRFRQLGIGLRYKTYNYDPYPQLHGQFQGGVTVLDLLFNCGTGARRFLKSKSPAEEVLL